MIHYASKQKYTRQTDKNKKFWIKIWIFKEISNLIQKKRKYDFLKFKTVNKNEAFSGFLIQYMWFTKPDKVTTEL